MVDGLLGNKNIGVLMGGLSKEREISLKSGKAVAKALIRKGYKSVVEIDAGHDLAFQLKDRKIDVAFNLLHGRYGEDGCVQGLLEIMKIPYTGSGVLASAISMNKVYTKRIFDREGIPTPPFAVFNKEMSGEKIKKGLSESSLKYPLVVKPGCEGSTIGLSVVSERDELDKALNIAFDHDSEVVIEQFVKGKELTVSILGNEALPLVEIVPKSGIFDYKSKYTKGLTDYYVPARVPVEVSKEAQRLALWVFDVLDCSGYSRVDCILDDKGDISVLELNSIPGMTDTSLVPMAAKEAGIDFETLVEKILLLACLKTGV